MSPDSSFEEAFLEVLLDPDYDASRREFCHAACDALSGVASWAGVDAWLGGGDVKSGEFSAVDWAETDRDRYAGFRALAMVLEMASQVGSGATAMLESDLPYAAGALVRQLIETEYLLTAFLLDFTKAVEWASATPDQIRRDFSPKSMRSIGGFSNLEYWQHCDVGGHPSPAGRTLLRWMDPSKRDGDVRSAASRLDLAQHLSRTWTASDELLLSHHARYSVIRDGKVGQIDQARDDWLRIDPIAAISTPET